MKLIRRSEASYQDTVSLETSLCIVMALNNTESLGANSSRETNNLINVFTRISAAALTISRLRCGAYLN